MKHFFAVAILFCLGFPDLAHSSPYVIQVDFKKAELHVFNEDGVKVANYLVALPKKTPQLPQKGSVLRIEKNPYWAPTKATRTAYINETGKELPSLIKSGDTRNAMGKVKIYIAWEGKRADQNVRIHGTNKPKSIGRRVSRGCIRMLNEDIEKLAKIVSGKKVSVIFS